MFKQKSLSVKTLMITWTITSIFTIIFTALQILYEYRGERRELMQTYNIVNDLYVAPIAESLWIMNKNILRTQGISLLGYPSIAYVKISDVNQIYFEDGDPVNHEQRRFALRYDNEEIGTLEIALDPTHIEQRFFKRIMVTVLIQGLKTFLVCIVLFYTYEQLITRSIRRVSHFLNSNPDIALKGEKIPFEYEREDEIGILVRNLNVFVDYIYRLNRNLKELNDSLERKVLERTKELIEKNSQLTIAIEDLEKAHDQIAMSERMASLGKMTAGIAHEIKNPIYIIINSVTLIKDLVDEVFGSLSNDDKEKVSDDVTEVKDLCVRTAVSCNRVSDIITSMLSLSRSTDDQKEEVDLVSLTEKSVRFAYEATMAKNIFDCELKFNFEIPNAIETVYKTELSRALINICDNAFYSMYKKFLETKHARQRLEVTFSGDEEFYYITITDSGQGIPEGVLKNLFYPFFTTKPAGEGTGLGMSMSYDIVKKHGGKITVNSKVGEGATFVINLPREKQA